VQSNPRDGPPAHHNAATRSLIGRRRFWRGAEWSGVAAVLAGATRGASGGRQRPTLPAHAQNHLPPIIQTNGIFQFCGIGLSIAFVSKTDFR